MMGEKASSSSGLRSLKYYVLALLLVATGVIVRIMLTHLVGPGLSTYITFYPAVMLAALIGGWRPGFLATLATVAVVDYWLLLPVGLFKIDSRVEIVGVAFFGAMGMFMSIVAELYRRTRGHLEELVSLRTIALSQANEQLQEQGQKLQAQTEEVTAVNVALRESEQRWATTLGSIGDAVIATDLAGRITFMNAVAEGLTGWAFHEALQKPVTAVFNVINEKTRREVENPVTRVLQERRIVGLANHTILVRKDGTQVPIDDSGSPIKGDKGNIIGVVLIFRDITERKRAEEALRQSEERFHRLFEDDLTGDFLCMPEGKILLCNPAFAKMLGFSSPEEAVSTSMLELYPDPGERTSILDALKEKGKLEGYEAWRKRRDGEVVHVVENLVAHFDSRGELIEIQGYIFDDTARKRAEEAVEEARRLVERERNLLQSMIDSARNSHLVYLDRDFNFVRVNEAYARTCGYRPEEMIGKNHFALYAHEENEAIFARVRDTGVPVEFHDKAFVFPDQPERGVTYWDWTLTPVKDRSGAVDGLVFSLFETTERKRAEEALKQSEAGLARAQAISHLANWEVEVGADGILGTEDDRVRGSAELYRMFNLEKHHNLGAYIDKFHPEDRAYVVESIRAAIYEGKPYKVEYRIIPRAGEIRHVYAEGEVIRDEKGLPGKFFGTVQDITARKEAEERERKKQEETSFTNRILRLFVEHEGDELFERVLAVVQEEMTSKHGVFGYIAEPGHLICPSLSRMLDQCDVEGKCIHYPPEKWKGLWARALIEKRSFYTNQAPPVPPRHPIIHNNLAAPILFQGGAIGLLNLANKEGGYTEEDRKKLDAVAARMAPVLYAWIHRKLRDDERKRTEEQLRKAHDELEKRVEERTAELSRAHDQVRFFASQCLTAQELERKRIAGELHDCTAASLVAMKFRIEQVVEEMKKGKASPESLQNLSSMVSEINNDIRRIMADLRPSVLDDLGIIAAINWFCREYQKTYSHISVETQIGVSEDEVPSSLRTPIFRISQEAMNNIAKHSKATVVNLSLKRGSGVELVIRDNGQGFDMETVRRGMGSSTMRERCELAGGTFNMESVKSAGTTIRCTWPST